MSDMTLEKAIKLAINGEAILFLGSGASKGAINQNDDVLVTGSDLADRIWPGCDELQQSVDLFLDGNSEQGHDAEKELIEFLKKEFKVKSITESHKQIPSIPWKRIYTTNYDNVVEHSYLVSNRTITSLTLADKAKKHIGTSELLYLHINGSIRNLTKDTINGEFKLTDVSYNTDGFSNSDWGNLFRSDLKTYSVVIFIGFSMRYDLDIRRLVNEMSKGKCVFIVAEQEREIDIKYLKKYGLVECIGLDGFIERLIEIRNHYEPCSMKTIENTILTNFDVRHNSNPILQKPSDRDVLSYYMTGKRTNQLYYPIDNNYKAVAKRNAVKKVVGDINSGIKAIFIHSDLGNGKTEAIEQICMELSNEFRKYILIDNNEKISQEIEMICQSNYKNIIIVENFFNYHDVYEKFKLFNNRDNITYIFTARTSIYRNSYEPFAIDTMTVYDLNRLVDNEIDSLISVFNEYGYYLSEDSSINTKDYIKKKCNSKLQAIVLTMFNHTRIVDSLNALADDLLKKDNKNYFLRLFVNSWGKPDRMK